MEAIVWEKLADGIPAVAVTLIFLAMGLWVVYPIVRLVIEKFIPLADRVACVLEVHGKSSQQLADVLQDALHGIRDDLATEKRERQEQVEMLQTRIRELEAENAQLKKENDVLKREVETLHRKLNSKKQSSTIEVKKDGK